MLIREQPAEFLHPDPVGRARNIVLHEGDEQADRTENEQRADEVVDDLRELCQPGEQRVSDHGEQNVLSEQDDQPGDPKQRKADRGAPVNQTLPGREASNLLAGGFAVQAHRALPRKIAPDHQHHEHQRPAADDGYRPIADLPPCLSLRLDQHTGLAPFHRGVLLIARAHRPPHRCVVHRLRLLALRLRLL